MTPDESALLADLAKCERSVWDALVAGDQAADRDALDEAFLGVYSDGFADRAAHVGQLNDGPTVRRYALSDMRVIRMGDAHGALSYRAEFSRIDRRHPEVMYVTSIWRRAGDGWVNIFSQDTPAV